MKDSEKVKDLRRRIRDMYDIETASYLVTWVLQNELKLVFHNQRKMRQLYEYESKGLFILYEIPKDLKPSLHDHHIQAKHDENYGIDANMIKVCIHTYKEDNKLATLPRFIWVNKEWSLKELHIKVFQHVKHLFICWYKSNANV